MTQLFKKRTNPKSTVGQLLYRGLLVVTYFVWSPLVFGSEGAFLWLEQLFGVNHHENHVYTAIIVAGLLTATTVLAGRQVRSAMASADGALIPADKMTFRNFFEIIGESIFNLVKMVMGEKDAARFFPLIGTLFLFIFASNIIGLIPGFLPPTENINTTFALGFFVFLTYNAMGFKEHGIGYLKHFLGPLIWIAPLMLVIEVVSHVVRPLSLALRLRGNIMGDHLVLSIFLEKAPYIIPVVFYGLGVFVSFIQAFVFVLLTMVYISLATSHDH